MAKTPLDRGMQINDSDRPTESAHDAPRLLTVAQVAQVTALSEATIRRAIRLQTLGTHRIGRAVRVSVADLSRFVEKSRRGA